MHRASEIVLLESFFLLLFGTISSCPFHSPLQKVSGGELLLLVGGVMGTGKSTIAQELQRACQCPLLSTDTIRKHLAHLDPTHPQAEPFGAGIYDPSWTQKTYTALNNRAQAYLQR